ncbi:MAG: YceI family protein [Actinobacteria bacterium]|nr:YceI family protein [Actinomycetota bacterium]
MFDAGVKRKSRKSSTKSAFPTATFELTQPIELGSLPASGQQVTVRATGDLTLHGATKRVTVPLQAQRSGAGIRVAGSIPVVFAEWGIPDPSFGPAQTEDHGQIELLLVLGR